MTIKRTVLALGAAGVMSLGLSVSAMAQTSADPVMLSETCSGCHGVDGASVGPASPSLAGMDRTYFVQSMKDFVSGARPATIMNRIAKGYTEADFEAMADYFTSRPHVNAQQSFDPALAERGRELQSRYCETCHEQGGTVNDDGVTIVAGQWMPYLQFSIADFRAGHREMERRKRERFEGLMADVGEEGFEAILHYLASKQ